MKLENTGRFQQECVKVTEASYEIALLVVKQNASRHRRNSGESCILCATIFVLGEWSEDELKKISSSSSTVKSRNDALAQDINFNFYKRSDQHQILLSIVTTPLVREIVPKYLSMHVVFVLKSMKK
jgi:hypothetical protein